MVIILLVCIITLIGGCIYLFLKLSKEKKKIVKLENEKISSKDLQFIEFTVDMYIKYAKDLDICSKEQHEYIVKELERIREQYLTNG